MSEKEFLEQIRENQGIIYKVVSLYAADPEEKKDLYQEILLQCWKGWANFRGEAKFSTWLYRVCLNTVFTSMRKKTLVVYTDELPENGELVPSQLDKEDSVALHKAIWMLTDIDRAVILLHLEGYGNAEIAGMLGMTANTLSVKLYRIRQRLSKLLNGMGND